MLAASIGGHVLVERLRARRYDVWALVAAATVATMSVAAWYGAEVREIVAHQRAVNHARDKAAQKQQTQRLQQPEIKARVHDPVPTYADGTPYTGKDLRKFQADQKTQDKAYTDAQLAALQQATDAQATQDAQDVNARVSAADEGKGVILRMLRLFAVGFTLATALAAGSCGGAVRSTLALFRRQESQPALEAAPAPAVPAVSAAPWWRVAAWSPVRWLIPPASTEGAA